MGFCSNLGVRGLFISPFVSYWVHIDWLAPGYLMGEGNPTISWETETQVRAACQPRQPQGQEGAEGATPKSIPLEHKSGIFLREKKGNT